MRFVQLVPWPVSEGVLKVLSFMYKKALNYNESATLRMWRIDTNKHVHRWRPVYSY